MFDTSGFQRSMSRPLFAPANLPAEALAGVRTRRILALCVDFLVVSCLVFLIWLALLVATLGLSFFILPPLLQVRRRWRLPFGRAADTILAAALGGGHFPENGHDKFQWRGRRR